LRDRAGGGGGDSLHLKDEASSFADQYQVKELIKKYSEFINFPIYLWITKKEKVEVPADGEDDAAEDGVSDDDDDGEESTTATTTEERVVTNAERLNENKPIWTRSPEELTEQDYTDFYKLFSKDELDPIAHSHFKVRRRRA
jgi:heat shock protein 90kDa beta